MSRSRLLLGLILLLALLPRLAAVRFNVWPHGDVLLDAAVTDALVEQGALKVPLVDVRYYPTGRFGFGYPPDQHPPLWPLLGAVVRSVWPDSYEALKLGSLLVGWLLVAAVYRCGRDLLGRGAGLFAAAVCAASYLLIDFSGNGSLWSLLALFYVLFVWRASCFRLTDPGIAIRLGLLMGAGYLTNYPAVVLPITFAALLVIRRLPLSTSDSAAGGPIMPPAKAGGASPCRRAPTAVGVPGRSRPGGLKSARGPWMTLHGLKPVASAVAPLAIAALLILPWLAFNLVTFGSPVWSQPLERQLGGGDKQVEVVIRDGEVVKQTVPTPNPLGERLRTTALNLYGNVGFLVRQSFVLAPFLGGFSLAGLAALGLRASRGAGRELPLLLLTLAHGGLILLWPTTKFRYLVPLFPLAALIGTWLLWQVKPTELRNLLAGVALGLTCFTSAWTWASIPTHTYYYDGGVVGDNFGGQGEIAYMDDLRHLAQAAAAIRAAGSGAILGPHPLYNLARQPLVINSAAYSREVVEHLVARHSIRYVVAEPDRLSFYAAFLPGRVLWQDDRYGVYEVGGR